MHFSCNMLWKCNASRAYDTIHPSSTTFPFRGLRGAARRRATCHITEQRSSSERVSCVGVPTDRLPSPVCSIGHNNQNCRFEFAFTVLCCTLPLLHLLSSSSCYFVSTSQTLFNVWVSFGILFCWKVSYIEMKRLSIKVYIAVDYGTGLSVNDCLAIFCARPLPSFDGTDAKRSRQISQFSTVYFIYFLLKYWPQSIICVFRNVHTITLIIYS